ncbi:MAG: mannose-6-phosphate isomerase, class I, partial [Microbacterium sp.]
MLIAISNSPRDYAWGSSTLLAELEGREASTAPEAEVWFGDHPGDPAVTRDGQTLDAWLAEHRLTPLPYLLKLLAAASPLSIQAHPSTSQAEEGFAREEAAGIPRDAGHRTYRDANHKPELIVALSEEFRALAGLRPLADTRRLFAAIGDATAGLASRLDGSEQATIDAIAWLLSDAASADVRAIIGAAQSARSEEFAAELALVAALDESYPADAGIVVALLMNLVTLGRGEGLFVPAGVLHAYLGGLGVELMAASDNVMRGGLTPKHIDVDELVRVLDPAPGLEPRLAAAPIGEGLVRFDAGVPDFALLRAQVTTAGRTAVPLEGAAIVVVTQGELDVRGAASGETV